MFSKIAPEFAQEKETLDDIIRNFDHTGDRFVSQLRNTLKRFPFAGQTIVVKSYKVPNAINRFVYGRFRKPKAQRAYEYAALLTEKGILTPAPIAYYIADHGLRFGRSWFICFYQPYDYTYADLLSNPNLPERKEILQQFSAFTFQLHENGIEFRDHGPGNTLIIKKAPGQYEFYLIDINQMNFHKKMNYYTRMKNFAKLTVDKEVIREMSEAYAPLIGKDVETVYKDMQGAVDHWQFRRQVKHTLKLTRLKRWLRGQKKAK